ncbi:DegV family EDD domain-containing protein [Collinsella sp. AGMB00827]|uniref:DegV family EDD domain-containing protein n=1 Tax=Collinsella ureilytica TaxID=2869515 RepID=A0ABS7MLG6_9ACTN|nr:DegV family protein [Collinsella urealyticum]MBY4798213.1 DegV family EDD domain-containing protein [Collinsella urealyticum]
MARIIITAETGCDLPLDVARELGVELVPMHVSIGEKTVDDGEISAAEMLEECRGLGVLPRTSGCTPRDFAKVFSRIREREPEASILHLAYSAVTTCSYESACVAAEGLDNIELFDTEQVTIGQGFVVSGVAAWLREHPEARLSEALSFARDLARRTKMSFIPGDLGYLRAGGRLSNAAFVGATLLRIKPVVEIVDGRLVATKKLRGKMDKAAINLVDMMLAGEDPDYSRAFLVRATGLPDPVQRVAEARVREHGFQEVTWYNTGNVITAHGGPGAFGLAFARKA